MNSVDTLLKTYFSRSTSELWLGELPVSSLAADFGTPLFVYDQGIVAQKLALLQHTLPPNFAISYSIKANPQRAFLQFFLSQGCGLEIASGGELYQALSAGCPPERIIFAGPGKREEELRYALENGIGEIHAESHQEITRIGAISRQLGRPARVAIRVNPSEAAQGGAMRMGGKAAPFGIDEECLESAVAKVLTEPGLIFCGLHLFTGTQILDHSVLLTQYRRGLEMARQIFQRFGQPLDTLDFGGGYGIPYFAHEQALDMAQLGQALRALFDEYKDEPALRNTHFMVEPGRFLVGEAGVYVTRISDIKISRGKKFVIVDGGMHHHLAASGNLGQTIKRNFPVAILNKLDQPTDTMVDVVGPLCTPLDGLARAIELPQPEIGDLIGVFLSGAYARTASPLGFLSHPTPPEVWLAHGQARLIRRRGTYQDYEHDLV
ncbi:MAG: type III PLP-dependent enzyme [Chloroflexi bacterium]|nr:type III PLP-dependent enzyme [Chloroflexota bacterium]